jgi:hypothetical protein
LTLQNGTQVSDSGIIEPNSYFTYRFEQSGIYHFTSSDYPSIDGDVYITDDIITMTANLENGIDVQISWTPTTPSLHKVSHFKAVFIDSKTGRNQENITQVFSITDSKGNSAYPMRTFLPTGVQTGAHVFETEGEYTVKTSITYVNFIPSEADAEFALVTTPELSVVAAMIISGVAISAIALLTRFSRLSIGKN